MFNWVGLVWLLRVGFLYVAQASPELESFCLCLLCAGITDVHHHKHKLASVTTNP